MTLGSYKTIMFCLLTFVSFESHASDQLNYFLDLLGLTSYSQIQIDSDLTLITHKDNTLSLVKNNGNLQRIFEFSNDKVFLMGKLKNFGKEYYIHNNFSIKYPVALIYKNDEDQLGILESYKISEPVFEDRFTTLQGTRYLALINALKKQDMIHYSLENHVYEMTSNDLLIEIISPKKIRYKGKDYSFELNNTQKLQISTGRGSEYFPAD